MLYGSSNLNLVLVAHLSAGLTPWRVDCPPSRARSWP